MGKKKKHKKRKSNRPSQQLKLPGFMWQDEQGQVHSWLPGPPPTPEMLQEMTQVYQENIRKSPLWDLMVKEFGLQKAEEILKECRVELR